MTYDPATFTAQAKAEVAKHDARVPEQRAGELRAVEELHAVIEELLERYPSGTRELVAIPLLLAHADALLADHRGREAG